MLLLGVTIADGLHEIDLSVIEFAIVSLSLNYAFI